MKHGPKQYQPVGRCIYCGSSTGKLTNEHILMYALGGKEVLPKSSCTPCSQSTSQVEQFIARDMWGGFRAMSGIQSRQKKPIETYPLLIETPGQEVRRFLVPVKQMPGHLSFPKLSLPVILTKAPFETFDLECSIFNADELQRYKGNRMHLGAINLQLFARFLAKTAHCFVTAELGWGNFTPLLTQTILGIHPRPSDFIGTINDNLPVEPNTYRMSMMDMEYNEEQYIAVTIRLFGMFGMPEYIVITGTRNAAG